MKCRRIVRIDYGRGFRRNALVVMAIGGLLAFAPQASAQPFVTSSTTVQASPSSVTTGQQVVLTATVTCPGFSPGGLGVTFFDGAVLLDTVAVAAGGQAVLTTSFSTPDTHTITAAYNGDANCGASSNTTTVEVSAAPAPPTPKEPCDCHVINLGNVGTRVTHIR
jgi:Bacterial Ig-like domain (group 3)